MYSYRQNDEYDIVENTSDSKRSKFKARVKAYAWFMNPFKNTNKLSLNQIGFASFKETFKESQKVIRGNFSNFSDENKVGIIDYVTLGVPYFLNRLMQASFHFYDSNEETSKAPKALKVAALGFSVLLAIPALPLRFVRYAAGIILSGLAAPITGLVHVCAKGIRKLSVWNQARKMQKAVEKALLAEGQDLANASTYRTVLEKCSENVYISDQSSFPKASEKYERHLTGTKTMEESSNKMLVKVIKKKTPQVAFYKACKKIVKFHKKNDQDVARNIKFDTKDMLQNVKPSQKV